MNDPTNLHDLILTRDRLIDAHYRRQHPYVGQEAEAQSEWEAARDALKVRPEGDTFDRQGIIDLLERWAALASEIADHASDYYHPDDEQLIVSRQGAKLRDEALHLIELLTVLKAVPA